VVLADGDFVDLDWLATPAHAGSPLLLVLHGLEGSARSHYAQGLIREAAARSWRAVVLNFRSCSGELNRLPKFYHSGETDDLDAIVRRLQDQTPRARIGVVGVSLGGNVLLKWLGEQGEAAPSLAGAVAISAPFDLAACTRVLDRGLERAVYTANFLRTMRRKVQLKARLHPAFVDVAAAWKARTFGEYDNAVTAPLNGFADAIDYWRRASSGPYLGRVRRPTLLINARDDPFVPPEALPDPATLPSCVQVEFPVRGGHVGFIDGRWPWRVGSWAERRAIEFLAPRLEEAEPLC
jgi:predicted alpha/beta-fold hydrolase